MPSIFVAAVDSAQDRTDLERSVAMPIERQHVIRSFSDATYAELIDIERRGHGFYAWGLRGDPDNIQHWFQMGVGDFVLLVQREHFRYYAKVLGRYQNARAASLIWGTDQAEQEPGDTRPAERRVEKQRTPTCRSRRTPWHRTEAT